VFEDPGQLRQIVRDRQQSLMAEAANDRQVRSSSTAPTRAAAISRGVMRALIYGAVTIGAAIAIFLAVSVSVQLVLSAATSGAPSTYGYPAPSYAYATQASIGLVPTNEEHQHPPDGRPGPNREPHFIELRKVA
jgi:hypothetical protein